MQFIDLMWVLFYPLNGFIAFKFLLSSLLLYKNVIIIPF